MSKEQVTESRYYIVVEGVVRPGMFDSVKAAIDHCHTFQMTYPRADLCIEGPGDELWVWDGERFTEEASA